MFQYQNILISKIEPMLRNCLDVICDLKLDKGENEWKFFSCFSAEDEMNIYEGIELSKEHSIEIIRNVLLSVFENVVFSFKYL